MAELSPEKRIARNTTMLYIRMALTIVITLFSQRVITQMVGDEGYGTLTVVGGLITIMTFLNATMASATSRFIIVEMASGNPEKLNKTFISSLFVHIVIAAIFLLLAETIGLWWLEYQLEIPEHLKVPARWLFHFSILLTMIRITQVPYDACIIAHERMDIYAYLEVGNVVLKLLILFLIPFWSTNPLISYAIMLFLVTLLIATICRFYAVRKFAECRFRRNWDRQIIKSLLSFSMYDLYGNVCLVGSQQGVVLLFNKFFGVLVNGVCGYVMHVQNAVYGLAFNVVMAFRPQITARYTEGNYAQMYKLMTDAGRLSSLLYFLIVIPIYFEMNFIMKLWLGDTKEYLVEFNRIVVLYSWFMLVNTISNVAIHATGKIGLFSFISGTILLLPLPFIYLLFHLGYDPTIAYTATGVSLFTLMSVNFLFMKYTIPQFRLWNYLHKIILSTLFVGSLTIIPVYFLVQSIEEGWFRIFIVTFLSTCVLLGASYTLLLSKTERTTLLSLIRIKLLKQSS